MIPRVGELKQVLEMSRSDLQEVRFLKRQRLREKIAHVALPAFSAIAGLVAGDALHPIHEQDQTSYPYGLLMMAAPATALSGRRSWIATIIVSLVLFIFAFSFISWVNSGVNNSFGVTTKYGVFHTKR